MRGIGLVVMLISLTARGQVVLPRWFSDNMVVQRGRPVHFWGKAVPGAPVRVSFAGEVGTVIAGADSSWSVLLRSLTASSEGRDVTIMCQGFVVVLKNVLVGDVWVCSGQSNMEFPFFREAHAREEWARAGQPLIRWCAPAPAGRYVYGVAYGDSLTRRLNRDSLYLWDGWRVCDSGTVGPMSAVAYYFASEVVGRTGIPVGLINLSIGGAPIETFISREALAGSPEFAGKVRPGNWMYNDLLPAWVRERGMQNIGGGGIYGDDLGPNHAYKPGFAFECGIRPILPMAVKGVIWYQGESNSLEWDRVVEYPALMRLLIADYRKRWHEPRMPFYWVQLSSIDTAHYQSRWWPEFRDGQRRLLSEVRWGGMAVCSDIGARDDVHPTNKKEVGERLGRWALRRSPGRSGPLPVRARWHSGEVVISFAYGRGLRSSDGGELRGFSLDGRSPAAARVEGRRVRVVASGVRPDSVYYGWRPYSDGNLINYGGLPASTFKISIR